MTATDSPIFRDLFIAGLDRFGPRPAVVAGDTTWTYRQIVDHANRLAQYLDEAGGRTRRPRSAGDVQPGRVDRRRPGNHPCRRGQSPD